MAITSDHFLMHLIYPNLTTSLITSFSLLKGSNRKSEHYVDLQVNTFQLILSRLYCKHLFSFLIARSRTKAHHLTPLESLSRVKSEL